MKFLTRQEELVLLAVFFLKEKSILLHIREYLIKETGKEWSISSVYVPLDRLTENGFLEATIGEPVLKRGGRAKKYYELTKVGKTALNELRTLTESMWKNAEGLAFEGSIDGKI